MLRRTIAILVPFLLLCATSIAHAQIEEVVVTAQKRAESIQDVPISMQALGGSDIDHLEIKRADDVTRYMANVHAASSTSDTQINYYIRGVGEGNFHANSVGAIGLYLDEVALNTPVAATFALFDVERVEVLRGPQNTLFGKNTTGGAINYISRRPEIGGEANGYLELTYGRWDQLDVEGAFGDSLTENLAFRVSMTTNNRDEIIRNIVLNTDEYDIERHAGRGQLLWTPTEDVEVLFNVHGGVNRGGNVRYVGIGTQDPTDLGTPGADPNGDGLPFTTPCASSRLVVGTDCVDGLGVRHTGEWDISQSSTPNPRNDIDSWGANIRVDWDLGWASLASITAYESNQMRRDEDSGDTPGQIFAFHQETELDQWSQELRLTSQSDSRMRWILGAYFFMEENVLTTVVRRTPPGTVPGPAGTQGPGAFTILPSTEFFQDDTEVSLYGQGEYDFTDQLTLTLGIRGSWENKEGWNIARIGNGGQFGNGQFIGADEVRLNPIAVIGKTPLQQISREWGGKASLDYRFNDDLLVYGGVSRGFKGGGFSVAALQAILAQAARAVEPEILTTYEGGMKSTWFDGTVQFNAAVFYNAWENQQIFSLILDQGLVLPLLINVPETHNWGADLEVVWVPEESWHLQLGVGFLDSEVDDATDLPTVTEGNRLPYNPDVNFTGLVRKEWALGNGVASLQTDFQYTDDQTFDIENKLENGEDSTFEIGARGSYAFGPDGKYSVSVWGKNLTSEQYCVNVSDLRGGLAEVLPCTSNIAEAYYGVTAKVNWD